MAAAYFEEAEPAHQRLRSISMVSSEDSECAQALLELAMSNSPPHLDESSSGEEIASYCSKRTYEDPAVFAHRADLIKKIKLDHCYYWVQENEAEIFKSYCESIIQNGQGQPSSIPDQDDVDITFQRYPPKYYPPRAGKENVVDVAAKLKADSLVKREKKIAMKNNILHTKSFNKRFGDPYMFEDDGFSSRSSFGDDEDSNQSGVTNGLDLLLKCLSDNQPSSQRSESHTSQEDEDDFEDSETESEDETGYRRQPDVEYEYKCRHCLKTFTKKRYLTKHVRRMHPDGMITSPEEVSTACPNCLKVVSKRNFQRHLLNCQFDLIGCPLCGIHVRRENLSRHTEKEHSAHRSMDLMGNGNHKLQQLADLVFNTTTKQKTTKKSPKNNQQKGNTQKKNTKKSPANRKGKTNKGTAKKVSPNRKPRKSKATTPPSAGGPKNMRYFSSPDNFSLESTETMFDSPDEDKDFLLRNALVSPSSDTMSPMPGSSSHVNSYTPTMQQLSQNPQLDLSPAEPSANGSMLLQSESSNGVKSKVILQPTRIKNMVSVSV